MNKKINFILLFFTFVIACTTMSCVSKVKRKDLKSPCVYLSENNKVTVYINHPCFTSKRPVNVGYLKV